MDPLITLQLAQARILELQSEARCYRLAKSLSRRPGDKPTAGSPRLDVSAVPQPADHPRSPPRAPARSTL
jgi:hypothetical protein